YDIASSPLRAASPPGPLVRLRHSRTTPLPAVPHTPSPRSPVRAPLASFLCHPPSATSPAPHHFANSPHSSQKNSDSKIHPPSRPRRNPPRTPHMPAPTAPPPAAPGLQSDRPGSKTPCSPACSLPLLSSAGASLRRSHADSPGHTHCS